jgi:xylan 1,4-beta-xylosidase
MKPKLKMPTGVTNQTGKNGFFPNGNFTFSDNFTAANLDFRWIAMRGPRDSFITTSPAGGVSIKPFAANIHATAPVSSLFHRFQHKTFDVNVTMNYIPRSDKDLAGITCYQGEKFNYVFGVTKRENDYYLVLARTEKGATSILASTKVDVSKPMQLQVLANHDDYKFNYSLDGQTFQNLGGTVSGDILSTNVAGGFTGSLLGLYATSGNTIQP